MPFFVTVSEGPRADRAKPIVALSEPATVRKVLRLIGEIGEKPGREPEALREARDAVAE